jgi:site-specific recombinase XerD
MLPNEIESFTDYLKTRHYSPHTVANYELDLRLFFALIEKPPSQVTWRDVDCFLQQQHRQGLAPTTVNRRIHALKSFYEFLFVTSGNDEYPMPIKPSHYVRQGRPLPKKLTTAEVKRLFAAITNEVDKTLFLLMLRCGLRVAEVAALKLSDIDWTERALIIRQGKGRKDRRVYLSSDILSSLEQLFSQRPRTIPEDVVFWNQKRLSQPLSIKAIQKKMERYAKSAGIKASCHSLRHTFASNLLEEGAEVVYIKEFLGHNSIASSERYAKLSNQRVKQMYLQTIGKVINKTRV